MNSRPVALLLCASLLSAALLMAPAQLFAEEATLPLNTGPTYVRFETLPETSSLAEIFGDSLPGAAGWAAATRILTADRQPVLGSYYDTRTGSWRGTLKRLEAGSAYWIVLPYGHPGITLILPGVTLTAGAPRIGNSGTMVTIENGVTKVQPSAPPRSSATREIVKEKPTKITAGSGVYVQEQQTPGMGEQMWVKLPLDTLFTGGKKLEGAVPVPLASGGIATVLPPPDFSRPPWGTGDPPE